MHRLLHRRRMRTFRRRVTRQREQAGPTFPSGLKYPIQLTLYSLLSLFFPPSPAPRSLSSIAFPCSPIVGQRNYFFSPRFYDSISTLNTGRILSGRSTSNVITYLVACAFKLYKQGYADGRNSGIPGYRRFSNPT